MITLSMLVLFTACVDQNSINVKKEKEMREEATLDISKMPIQTYEEYIELKRFVLEQYIENQNAKKRGIAYLNDGTKIEYSDGKSEVSESIFHLKRPFVEVQKIYHVDNKNIKYFMQMIANLDIGKAIIYNYFGEVQKIFDVDSDLRKKGLNYKKLLEGAEKQGFIDLEEGKLLKGDDFEIYIEERKNLKWSREKKEKFAKEMNLSFEVVDEYSKSKYCWRFDINNDEGSKMHTFTRDGVYVGHFASSRRMRY